MIIYGSYRDNVGIYGLCGDIIAPIIMIMENQMEKNMEKMHGNWDYIGAYRVYGM